VKSPAVFDLKTTVQETQGIQGLLRKLLDILQPNQKDPDLSRFGIEIHGIS
jgi:hypothetical protein